MSENGNFEERMTDDLGMHQLTEDSMCCADCKNSEGEVLSCKIYAQKPDGVLDGEPCQNLRKR